MFDFNKPNIEITDVSDDKKYGRFVVEPLERGYGTTLGNALRRIMLSSPAGSSNQFCENRRCTARVQFHPGC